jgi:hypothetical protein
MILLQDDSGTEQLSERLLYSSLNLDLKVDTLNLEFVKNL